MDFFTFKNYKDLVNKWVLSRPQNGRGQYKQIADHLRLSTVTISQVFKGEKQLSLEQAISLVDFMALTGLQKEFFLLLVQYNRAGSHALEKHFKEKLDALREDSKNLKTRLPQDKQLAEIEKARFYSHWIYGAIRLATSIETLRTPQQLAERFDVPLEKINEALEFLMQVGLIVEKNGKYLMGPQRLHLEKSSPYIKSRQMGWRLKGFETMDSISSDEIFYTAPMSLPLSMIPEIKEQFLALIEKINARVVEEKPEELVCLNIDLFRF